MELVDLTEVTPSEDALELLPLELAQRYESFRSN